MESPPLTLLPDHRDLYPHLLRFLEEHFVTPEDLCKARSLEICLTNELADSNTNLDNHQRKLTNLVVSWISHCVSAQKNLQRLDIKLRDLISSPFRYKICSTTIGKNLGDFSEIVKEVCRVNTIRNYAETTLRLEGLVGDLEDAVFRIMNQHSRTTFSTHLLSPPNSSDYWEKHENLLQAVNTMNTIEEILFSIKKTQPQWNNLTKLVDNRLDEIMTILRPQIFTDYRAIIASIGWPPNLFTSKTECNQITDIQNPLLYMPREKTEKFFKSFLSLCALQHLQSRRESRKLNFSKQEESNTEIWAINELVSSIALQTEHHFTKWAIDQPEFIFALVFRITRDFITGVDDILQPLIDKARLSSYSAKGSWVYAMVQMLVGFLVKQVFSDLAKKYKEKHLKSEASSSWLHLIDLIIAYDKKMQSLLDSEPGIFEGFSRNMSALSALSHKPDWLKIWAAVELRDARKKLKENLKDEKSWVITEFLTGNESDQNIFSMTENVKYPLIAETAVKLAWEMIDRCRNLSSITMQTQFIKLTVDKFLWHFFNVLLLRCKKPESSSTHLEDDALLRLCGSINAARYIESNLQEWSNDVIFLEMDILQINFFSEEINTLAELETNWLIEVITDILFQFEFLSRDYFRNINYTKQVINNTDLALSCNLIEALDFLKTQIHKMKKFLNPIDFMDLWRNVANGIDHFIFSNILKNNIQFSDEVVEQFRTDMHQLFHVFQPFCARPEAFFPCLRDTLNLLKLKKKEVSHFLVDICNDGKEKDLLRCNVLHLLSDQVESVLRMRKFCM